MLDVMNKEQIFADLKHLLSPESVLRLNESLARKTTLRVGGPADVYVEPCSEFDLARVFRFCAQADIPFTVLGRGSNLLIRDGGIGTTASIPGSQERTKDVAAATSGPAARSSERYLKRCNSSPTAL